MITTSIQVALFYGQILLKFGETGKSFLVWWKNAELKTAKK